MKVSMVVEGKADQTDVEALQTAMQRLDATVAAKARGTSATVARDAEAIAALQVAFKDMSSSMEGSMRKLQQACCVASQFFTVVYAHDCVVSCLVALCFRTRSCCKCFCLVPLFGRRGASRLNIPHGAHGYPQYCFNACVHTLHLSVNVHKKTRT